MTVLAVLGHADQVHAQEAGPVSPRCSSPPPPDFEFWIGTWDIVNLQRQPAGDDPTWYTTGDATSEVRPVVGGCGVAEYWWGDLSYDRLRGFSLRSFDGARAQWTAILFWPNRNQPGFGSLEGQFRHGRGEFFTSRTDEHGRTTLTRFTFSDIRPNALRWDAAASGDSGMSWRPSWIMEFTRRPPEALAPRPLWADSVPRCDFPELYEFDFALGSWTGTATIGAADAQPARLESHRIVGSCALEERLEIGDAFEAFEVRAFVPNEDGWVAYRLDSHRPVLQRLAGSVTGGRAELAGTQQTQDGLAVLVTEQWQWRGDAALRYELRESRDGGTTWTSLVGAELSRDAPTRQ